MIPTAQPDAALARRLRYLRRFRKVMIVALFGPIVLTGLIVLVSRLTGGGLRFMVNGEPWTYWFWYGLFYTLVLGGLMAMRTLLRLCPACGQPFCQYTGGTKMKTVKVGDAQVRYGFRRSVFVTACVNCGVSVLHAKSEPRRH